MCEEDIKKCLTCEKPKCTNCLHNMKPYNQKKKKKYTIVQIDPDTGKTVKIYGSYQEAAEASCTSERNIRRYTALHAPVYRGYLWRRLEVKDNNV